MFFILSLGLLGDNCLDLSYLRATGETQATINQERINDLQYTFSDHKCCCTEEILNLFRTETHDITYGRVNPAMDLLATSLRNQFLVSDLKIKLLVNLKYVNSLYSFYDKEKENNATVVLKSNVDGCKPFIFKARLHGDRKKIYREGILLEMLDYLDSWDKIEQTLVERIKRRI